MTRRPSDVVRLPEPSSHAVQIYNDVDELAAPVAGYLAAGFEVGDPAVVVATPEHWRRFAQRLAERGWSAQSIEQRGSLVIADADATLAAITANDGPSPARFEEVVGTLLDGVAARFPGRSIRVFGEMVDLLRERGRPEAAAALEELWTALALTRRFSLLCGYRLDLFDRASQVAPVPDVCRAHSHVLPAYDGQRLAQAVDLALAEVLGEEDAGKIYVVLRDEIREERVPATQLVLMWVSANMPVLAERILASARAHYFGRALAATG